MTNTNVKEPEWTSAQKKAASGSTTFKKCGWCKYMGTGSCRYNCYIEGNCSLLTYEDDVTWDMDCKVLKMSAKDLQHEIGHKRYEIKSNLEQNKNTEKEIATLKKLKAKAKHTPILPNNRSGEHFKLNVRVMIYADDKDKWVSGTVVNGYRTYDGCVSYDIPELKAKGWGCGNCVPTIILRSEFNYFKKYPEDFKTWLALSDKSYNGVWMDMKKIYEALVRSAK